MSIKPYEYAVGNFRSNFNQSVLPEASAHSVVEVALIAEPGENLGTCVCNAGPAESGILKSVKITS